MGLPAEPPLVDRSASGAEVQEDGHAEAKPRHCEELANCRMVME